MASSQRLSWPSLAPQLLLHSTKAPSRLTNLPRTVVRHKSGPYGYTQAKALIYSQNGEPSDVLK